MGKTISYILIALALISIVCAVEFEYRYSPYTGKLDRTRSTNQSGNNITADNAEFTNLLVENPPVNCSTGYYMIGTNMEESWCMLDDDSDKLENGTTNTVHFGKVGIGTSIPTSELHVIGDINATGNIYGNDVCETSIGNYCLSDLADYSLTSTIQAWFSDNRTYSDLTYQRKDDTATNLSNYWKLDGSSIATGNWNISPYTIESPIVYTNQTCYTPDCSSRIYYNGTGMIIEG